MSGHITICQLCRKRVFQVRNGEWYHERNASTSCRPGEGSDRRATPLEIPARAVTRHTEGETP